MAAVSKTTHRITRHSLPGTTTLHNNSNLTSPPALRFCEPSVVYTATTVATTCYAALHLAGYLSQSGATAPMTVTNRDTLIGARRRSILPLLTPKLPRAPCHRGYSTQHRASAAKSRCSSSEVRNAWKSRASLVVCCSSKPWEKNTLALLISACRAVRDFRPSPELLSCFCLSPMSSSLKIMWNLFTLCGRLPRSPSYQSMLRVYASGRGSERADVCCGPTPSHKRHLAVATSSSDFTSLVL